MLTPLSVVKLALIPAFTNASTAAGVWALVLILKVANPFTKSFSAAPSNVTPFDVASAFKSSLTLPLVAAKPLLLIALTVTATESFFAFTLYEDAISKR